MGNTYISVNKSVKKHKTTNSEIKISETTNGNKYNRIYTGEEKHENTQQKHSNIKESCAVKSMTNMTNTRNQDLGVNIGQQPNHRGFGTTALQRNNKNSVAWHADRERRATCCETRRQEVHDKRNLLAKNDHRLRAVSVCPILRRRDTVLYQNGEFCGEQQHRERRKRSGEENKNKFPFYLSICTCGQEGIGNNNSNNKPQPQPQQRYCTCNANPTTTAVAATRQNCLRAGMSVRAPTKNATASHTAAPRMEGATFTQCFT